MKELNIVEKMINTEYIGTDFYIKIATKNNIVILTLIQGENTVSILKGNLSNNIDTILYELIKNCYKNYINDNSRYVKNTDIFNRYKIKTLEIALNSNNQDKVNNIVQELVDRHSYVESLKHDIDTYKQLIKHLYNCKKYFLENEGRNRNDK